MANRKKKQQRNWTLKEVFWTGVAIAFVVSVASCTMQSASANRRCQALGYASGRFFYISRTAVCYPAPRDLQDVERERAERRAAPSFSPVR